MHKAVLAMQIKTPNLSRSQPQHHQLMMYILNAHQKKCIENKGKQKQEGNNGKKV